MALTLTIAAASKVADVSALQISQVANGRARAAFSVRSLTASYRPALSAEVLITEDATLIFGGLVDDVRERGAAGESGVGIITDITAVDFNGYASRRLASFSLPAGTLKAALQTIEPYLTGFGVSLDAGQVNGPTLPPIAYTLTYVHEILNELTVLTSGFGEPYVWNIDSSKTLSMAQASTVAAPFDVIGTSLPIANVVGDIVVESKRGSSYANRFVVYVPPATEYGHVDTFTGDGSTDEFFLTGVLFAWRGVVFYFGNYETLDYAGNGATWEYDPIANSITRVTGAPANAEAITINYDGTFGAAGAAEDAGEIAAVGLWEKILVLDAMPAGTTLQALADANLARSLPVSKTVRYRTMEPGLLPGMSQTINVPRRNVNTTAVVSEVVFKDIGKDSFIREVTTVIDTSQTNVGRGFRDMYQRWNALGGGAAGASVTTAPPATGSAALPLNSVQFNNAGAFGGDEGFKYFPSTHAHVNCVVAGTGSDITATSAESCAIFGDDCHIEDP